MRELWHISHYGWIPETAIRRGLTIAAGHEIPTAGLSERLRHLLDLGWAEQRNAGTETGEREWRLTDRGRRHAH